MNSTVIQTAKDTTLQNVSCFKDNAAPPHATVVNRFAEDMARIAKSGYVPPYGADEITQRAKSLLSNLFGARESYWLASGTSGVALPLGLIDRTQTLYIARHSHADDLELNAPIQQSSGCACVAIPTERDGKINPKLLIDSLERSSSRRHVGGYHFAIPGGALLIEQPTSLGYVYTRNELATLFQIAREHKLMVGIDGARYPNAVVDLHEDLGQLVAGADFLCLGLSKNGGLYGDVLMLLSSEMAAKTDILGARIKQAGHLIDRPWTITSQVNSLYEGGLWAEIATNANAMGERLRKSFKDLIHKEDHLVQEVYGSTNMTFAQLSNLHYGSAAEIFEHAPEKAYIWENYGHNGCTVRFVTSHATDVSIIDKLISKVDNESAEQFFAATMGGHPT